jgi:protein-S-isoprenylcysteine O-methyltransferase Ste14
MLYVRASVALVLPLLVDVVVPAMLLGGDGGRFGVGPVRYLGVVLVIGGAWLLFDSVFLRFAHEGRGTLAPIDPPRFVVKGGAYRWTRNPMYVANVAIILGTGLLVGSWWLFLWAAVVLMAFHLFIVAYEEPALRRAFGADYEAYCRDVPRWLPIQPRTGA